MTSAPTGFDHALEVLEGAAIAAANTAEELRKAAAGPRLADEALRVNGEWLADVATEVVKISVDTWSALEPMRLTASSPTAPTAEEADLAHVATLAEIRDAWGERALIAAMVKLISDKFDQDAEA